MSRIIPFCSSSKGNSVYIGSRRSGVLVDAGCSYKRLREYMNINNVDLDSVKAILVTHEHSDHIKGLYQLTKQTGIPVYTSAGTAAEIIRSGCISCNSEIFDVSELSHAPVDFLIKAFPTSHDSAESVGFTFENERDGYKIGYCTDTGTITDIIRKNLDGADLIFLESNYEPALLRGNVKYPFPLKSRIASELGHLSNPDCAAFLEHLVSRGTTRIILGHLSEENNTPEYAFNNTAEILSASGMKAGIDYTLDVAPVSSVGKVMAI